MSRPVYLCKRKPKTQAIIIDAKKEGNDIPITEINKINLSINVSLYNAEIIPKTIGATYWRSLASPSAYTIRILMVITFPFVWISQALSTQLTRDEDEIKKVIKEDYYE